MGTRGLRFVALAASALMLSGTFFSVSCKKSDDGGGGDDGEVPPAQQQPDVDMDKVHDAFWKMPGATQDDQLQAFEQEVNKYSYTDEHISVKAEKVNQDGQERTVVTGYVDKDGNPDYNPETDKTVFRFTQTAAGQGGQVPYEYSDAWGNVVYRGARVAPRTPFYNSYYYNPGPRVYYTSGARLAYLRNWRVGYRGTPGYIGWRGRFGGYRSGYGARVIGFRRSYGYPRVRVGGYYGRGYGYGRGVRVGGGFRVGGGVRVRGGGVVRRRF